MEFADQMLGAHCGEKLRIQVRGHAVSDQCPALLRYVRERLRSGALYVRVELQECNYGDSTFLGTLIQLHRETQAHTAQGFTLVAPSEPIHQSLRTMGLTRLFHIEPGAGEEPETDWELVCSVRCRRSSREFREQVVIAHRALADSSETRGAMYREIADIAASELSQQPPAE